MKKLFLLVLVVSLGGLFAQGVDWNITGAGARAMGMGGAFIGLADDATAISWNPAGLYQLQRMEASLVSQYYSENQKFDFFGETYEEGSDIFVINFASIAVPFTFGDMKITTAVALQRQLEIFYYNDGGSYYEEEKGAASTINLGAGSRFYGIFAAGLSANLWLGKYEYKTDYWGGEDVDKGDFSGFNLGFGAMADLNYLDYPLPLKVGVSMKTPFDLKLKFSDADITLQIPFMLGFGASYRLGEFLTLAADFETKAYKDKNYIYEEDSGYNEEYPISEYNLNQFRVGAEYLMVTDLAVIPLRAGFQNVPTTNSTVDDQMVGTGFSVGSGLIFERFAVDIFAYFANCKLDMGFGDYIIERFRAGVSWIFYF